MSIYLTVLVPFLAGDPDPEDVEEDVAHEEDGDEVQVRVEPSQKIFNTSGLRNFNNYV